jgi:hypothetical protein
MNHIDEEIRRALERDGETGPADAEIEESVQEMITRSFRGQARWLTLFAGMKIGGTLLIATLSAVLYALTTTPKALLALASLFIVSMTGCVMWWLWYWLLVQRNAQSREIKRLELQVATLTSRLAGQS